MYENVIYVGEIAININSIYTFACYCSFNTQQKSPSRENSEGISGLIAFVISGIRGILYFAFHFVTNV